MGGEDVEIGLGHGVAREGDLLLAEAVLYCAAHFGRRAGVDAAAARRLKRIKQRWERVPFSA
jgi:hypothetical protein